MPRSVVRVAAIATLACAAVAVAAPQRFVRGVVIDEATSLPIEGALAIGERASAATNRDGAFRLALAATETDLMVTAPGYATRVVRLAGNGALHVTLTPVVGEVIDISGTAPPVPVRPAARSYELSADDLRMLPGTANDALRAAQALPGVARLPYSFGGIVLRGTSPRDNVVHIDGIEVPIAFHFGGVTSFYPSSMLAGLTLSNGGLDASHGRVQGGMVELTTREPRTDKWRTGGSIGLLDSSVMAEGPIPGGGIVMGLRRSYFDIVAAPFAAEDTPLPSYYDAQIRTSFGQPTRRGRITPMLFLAYDHVATTEMGSMDHEDETSIASVFVRVAAPYRRQWGHLELAIVPWFGANQLLFRSKTSGIVEQFKRPAYPAGLRAELTRDFAWGDLRGGLDVQGGYLTHFQAGLGHEGDILQQVNGESEMSWADVAVYGETRYTFDRVSIKPGVRVEHYGLTGEAIIDPRLALHVQLTESLLLRETMGRYHQSPTPGDVDPHGGNPRLRSSYLDAVSLGVERELDGGIASVTSFFSDGQHLGVRDPSPISDFTSLGGLGPTFSLLLEKQLGLAFARRNVGRARNYGVELLVKRATKRWFGMIAYTLAKAERTENPQVMPGWRPFELDQRHNLNIAGSVTTGLWRFGARIQLVSGTPYSPTVESVQMPWAGTLPTFFQLDLRADRRWPQCWGSVELFFDIQNATNRTNIEGREPDDFGFADEDIRGLPIMPFIGVEFVPK